MIVTQLPYAFLDIIYFIIIADNYYLIIIWFITINLYNSYSFLSQHYPSCYENKDKKSVLSQGEQHDVALNSAKYHNSQKKKKKFILPNK